MKRFVWLIISTMVVLALSQCLSGNYKPYFDEIERGYTENVAISLSPGINAECLAKILVANNYIEDEQEAMYIAGVLKDKLAEKKALSNINDLKKRAWQLPMSSRPDISACPTLSERLRVTREQLGSDTVFRPDTMLYSEAGGSGKIAVTVNKVDRKAGIIVKCLGRHKTPMQGKWVRLSQHTVQDGCRVDSIMGYLQTDSKGAVEFRGLDPAQYYSVLPIDSVLEFGAAKGTSVAPLAETKNYEDNVLKVEFAADSLSIRLFSDRVLRQIRDDKRITVRTPHDFTTSLYVNIAIVLALFWLLALIIYGKNKDANFTLLALLMLIAGVGVVNMYALADPLTDTLLGENNARGVIFGLIIACLLANIDLVKFYQDKMFVKFDFVLSFMRWIVLPYRRKVKPLADYVGNSRNKALLKMAVIILLIASLPLLVLDGLRWVAQRTGITRLVKVTRCIDMLPKGFGYLLAAVTLTALLFTPLGAEVGGMKVNLNLGIPVQPSEVAKYLMVIFMAAFFCENATTIINYSREGALVGELFRNKLRLMLWFFAGILALMALYIKLSDMGPALVVLVTFVLFYSLIKSTVAIQDGDIEAVRRRKIFGCDFAMLVYGVVSFMAMIFIGGMMDCMLLLGVCWFVGWLIFFYISKRQIHESAIMFNAILAMFLFGGTILGALGFSSEAERFDQRMEMCTNTWGVIDMSGGTAHDPTSNSQVANGLWALASGGMTGQGLGDGMSQFVPAFYTDMVMMSLGENMGFVGIVLMLVLYAVLLWQTMKVGYKARHSFALYLCMGISIVTGVQLMTILMGALGLIPLTGVTVPFMSYGMASLVMNMVAYGLVLSVSTHANTRTLSEQARHELERAVSKYDYPIALLSVVGLLLFAVVAGSFYNNMVWNRNEILVKPVFAVSQNGRAVIDYNPRLLALADKMKMGNIYDRNGVVLATNDKSLLRDKAVYAACDVHPDTVKRLKRYYPFGEHLFFMLGDYNTKLLWNYDESNPVGYLAENQHLTELRGYDNRWRVDANGNHVTEKSGGTPLPRINIKSGQVRERRFAPSREVIDTVFLRDYSILVPYLKAGINSDRIVRFNNDNENVLDFGQIKPQDIHLTIDARLQVMLQTGMAAHVAENLAEDKFNKVRASIVILDAVNGDLLASANYPIADYDRMSAEFDGNTDGGSWMYYSDNYKPDDWKAFTDRDLGLTYQTAPGSTAKVMSSLAYFRKHPGEDAPKYYIDLKEVIYNKEKDNVAGKFVDLQQALRYSSNCYFINLVNDQELYSQLADVYGSVGMRVSGAIPYIINYNEATDKWRRNVTNPADRCVSAYRAYKESGKKEKMSNRTGKPDEWSWAWGQNGVEASPLTMTRVISVVANNGRMPVTRYLRDSAKGYIDVVSASDAKTMVEYLKTTAKEHDSFGKLSQCLGGKTGTPERVRKTVDKPKGVIVNDGWYICFIENVNIPGNKDKEQKLAIAVRIERNVGGMSGRAVKLTKDVVLQVLDKLEYINLSQQQ